MSRLPALLFDLDGTLTDSSPGICNCIEYALKKLGAPLPDRYQLIQYIGPPLTITFGHLLGPDPARIEAAVTLYRERFASKGLYENAVYEGIDPLLAQLVDRGHQLFVATAKPLVYARRILGHFALDRYFTTVHGSELDGTRSHKADLIGYVLAKDGLDAHSTLMVGDRRQDMVGAIHHGVGAVGVLWGYGSEAELRDAAADWLIKQPADLLDLLPPATRN